jgi:peptide/nickel transport system permease protein
VALTFTEKKSQSKPATLLAQVKKHIVSLACGAFTLVFILVALYGHLNSEKKVRFEKRNTANKFIQSAYLISNENSHRRPTLHPFRYLFGADIEGRSILARMIVGTKAYLFAGIIAWIVSIGIGLVMMIFPRFLSSVLLDVVESLPKYIIILLALTILEKPTFYHIVILWGILNSAKIGKFTLEKIKSLENRDFIESAEAMGHGKLKIVFYHLLWYNCLPFFIIQASLQMAEVIWMEVSLVYLGKITSWGYGVTPEPSWGNTLLDCSEYFPKFWYIAVGPLAIVILTIIGFYYIADKINQGLSRQKPKLDL